MPDVGGHIVYERISRESLYVASEVEIITAPGAFQLEIAYAPGLRSESRALRQTAIEIDAISDIVGVGTLLPSAEQQLTLPAPDEARKHHSDTADKVIIQIVGAAFPAAFLSGFRHTTYR